MVINMREERIAKVREMIGNEMSFTQLDNKMMEIGYYTGFNEGATSEIKQAGNVIYQVENNGIVDDEVLINFEITIDTEKDEAEEAFELKVLQVEEF